jgi:hypothetical protein
MSSLLVRTIHKALETRTFLASDREQSFIQELPHRTLETRRLRASSREQSYL